MKLPLTLALDPHHHQDTSDDDNKQSARCFADPPTILKDERSGELFIIELQGQLELEEDGDADDHSTRSHAGQKIGKLDMSIPVSLCLAFFSLFVHVLIRSSYLHQLDATYSTHRSSQAHRPDCKAEHPASNTQAYSPSQGCCSFLLNPSPSSYFITFTPASERTPPYYYITRWK